MVESVPITIKDLNNSGVVNVLGDEKLNIEERSVPITTSEELSDRTPLKDLNCSINRNQISNQGNLSIPTPFKKELFWTPSQDKKKDIKRNAKEKIHAVASSTQWQEYHQKKEAKKQLDILQKEEKKQQRLLKQIERKENHDLKWQNWKRLQMEDILNYEEDDVIKHIGKPKLINKREVYEVPECKV
ncbi:hypothetical protein FQA39_LY02289 [Lamprigera yunnana]|nr:hypothetical protein FQA39_LY02289 [Lamprigera yunnana]